MIDRRMPWLCAGLMLQLGVMGCLPAVVIVDRASVIEEESAGQWGNIEKELGLLETNIYPSLESPSGQGSRKEGSIVRPGGAIPKSAERAKAKEGKKKNGQKGD